MATNTQELETELERQQKNYLSRLEGAGRLPSIISEEWQRAGGAETANLRREEADLLKSYVSAGATALEKNKNIWDPYARNRFVAQDVAQAYAPIADIRSELAMRAEALGVATASATAMYGAETSRAATGLGFTESAYSRALSREQEARRQEENRIAEETRQRERAEDFARAAARSSGGGTKKTTQAKPKDDLKQDISDNFEYWVSEIKATPTEGWTENELLPALYEHYLPLGLTREEIKKMVYDIRSPYEEEGYF